MAIAVVDYQSPSAPLELADSLHQTGFAVLRNHPISWELVESIYEEWHSFFLSEAKHRYPFSREKQDGYFARPVEGTGPSDGSKVNGRDDKEFYHLFAWGRVPSEVSGRAMMYRTLAMRLGATLLAWVSESTPKEVADRFAMPLEQTLHGGEENTLLRILHYPPLGAKRSPTAMRAGAHKDTNLLTILACASEPGLEVRAGGTWEQVPWDPASLIVNGGVMLEMLSHGYYPSVLHRVTAPEGAEGTRPRLAMPLFLHPSDSTKLDDHQSAAEYLQSRLRVTYPFSTA